MMLNGSALRSSMLYLHSSRDNAFLLAVQFKAEMKTLLIQALLENLNQTLFKKDFICLVVKTRKENP